MALSDIVNVIVVIQNPGITQAGFGILLIVSHTATWIERTRTYTSLAGVGADFATNTPEYLAAAEVFAQQPCPPLIMIGRASNAPTQKYSIGVYTVANVNNYGVRIAAAGANGTWVSQVATYTSSSSDTNDGIISGLKTAIDALAVPTVSGVGGAQFTTSTPGSSGSHTLQILANTAGVFFSVEVLDRSKLSMAQTHADPGIVADLTAMADESNVWYGLVTTFNSSALVVAAAGYAETNTKIYGADTADTLVAR
jgi:Protein of unknown function (DUF3383)